MIITGYDNKYFVEYDFDFINVKNELKLLAVVFELKKVAGNHLLYLNIIPLLIMNKFITMQYTVLLSFLEKMTLQRKRKNFVWIFLKKFSYN